MSTIKHRVLLDPKCFSKKPTEYETSVIQKSIYKNVADLTITEILTAATKGNTFKASYLTGSESKNFVSASLLCIDVDNKAKNSKKKADNSVTFERAKAMLEEKHIYIAGAYTTFSNSSDWPKFRILIQLDTTITLLSEIKKLYSIIKGAFDFQDDKVGPCGLYYGGKEILYCEPNAITKTQDIYKIMQENDLQSVDNKGFERLNGNSPQSISIIIKDIDCGDKLDNSENLVISTLETHFFQKILQEYSTNDKTFDTFEAAITYAKSLDLGDLLGLPSAFKCIVHNDLKASAGIFKSDNGAYYYHCFACGTFMDITDFMAIFLNLDTQHDFITICNELNKLLNIKVVNSTWKENVDKQFKQSKKMLSQIDKFKPLFPKAVRALTYADPVYRLLADEALLSIEYVPAKDAKDYPLTRASIKYISKRTGLSRDKVRGRLEKLQQAGFIRQLDDKETKACSSYFGKTARIKKDDRYTINTYAIGYLNNESLSNAEACMIRFKESGATMKSMCAKQSVYIDGNNNTCVKSENLNKNNFTHNEKILLEWATRTIKRNKCFLKESLIKYGLSKGIKKDSINRTITMLTNLLNLKRITVSNEIIKKYALPKSALRKTVFVSK